MLPLRCPTTRDEHAGETLPAEGLGLILARPHHTAVDPRPRRRRDRVSDSTMSGFSNRPFGVKRFQTIHHHSVDVARGAVLLFGIGARALPSWVSKTGRNNLLGGLAVLQTAGPSRHTNSPHPSSRKGNHSTASWSSNVLLCCWIRYSITSSAFPPAEACPHSED
jgi:hypothetical protein